MSILLVLSHLGCFLAGMFMWNWITRREGESLTAEEEDVQGHSHKEDKIPRWQQRGPTPGAVILVAAALVLGLGIQQFLYQRDRDDLVECFKAWGTGMTDTLDKRSAANTVLEQKKKDRDDAVDGIISVVLNANNNPDRDYEVAFSTALAKWQTAKVELKAELKTIKDTREENPYPELDC